MPKKTAINIFLCGDVMTGRGIDQILPYPSSPVLHEPYVKNAKEYVLLAEEKNGPIPKPTSFSYIWGDALAQLETASPDLQIINLETSITTSDDYWRGKGINYRMNPKNVQCLIEAKIDCCCLANNHVLDWGYAGLTETLETLAQAELRSAGAGRNIAEAESPVVLEVKEKGRVIVFSVGSETSGVPPSWAASENKPGIKVIDEASDESVYQLARKVKEVKGEGDVVVVSIHWGANWGYAVPLEQKDFAHKLIDVAGVDVVYGHSSHHVKGMEVYKGKLVLYGCGDFLNDYEGIGGYESYRSDLCLMYFLLIEVYTGKLAALEMVPLQIRRFRVNNAKEADIGWLKNVLDREEQKYSCKIDAETAMGTQIKLKLRSCLS